MQKIISGKNYNTKTAEELLEYSSPHYASDFHCWSAALYKTSKGAYFIAGDGGPLSQYAQPAFGGGSTGGRGLRLVSDSEAREWVEEYGDADDYKRIFGEVEEG